jgi:hypothetical protein
LPLAFLLVVLSASIVTTGIRLGWFGPKSPAPCSSCWQKIGNDIDGEGPYGADQSGWSVSLSSDAKTVAIGTPWNDGAPGYRFRSGHVRIFQWTESTSTWTQVGADIDGEADGDYSGTSVSLSSDAKTVAIGAPRNHGKYYSDDDFISWPRDGFNNGHVRIFQWTESTSAWTQVGADIDGEAKYDESGYSVSLSSDGKTVAIGTIYNDGNAGDHSGHVRIFQWTDSTSTWTQVGADIDGEASYDNSGWSVSLSSDGKTVAIGAPRNDGNGGSRSGHVRIFQWTESTSAWTQVGADIDGEAAGDDSGKSVSLSSDGKTVAISAPRNDGNAGDSGHVRIFQWTDSNSTWTQVGADIDGEAAYDFSGWSMSLSSDGKTVAIGAPWNDGNGGSSGHVRIFQWTESNSTWTQVGADIDGEEAYDDFGWSVSL